MNRRHVRCTGFSRSATRRPAEAGTTSWSIVLLLLLAGTLQAATLRCAGVLGNSGESGASLVRYGLGVAAPCATGVGVVLDRLGGLWSRGGSGVLNRYALDGRLLGQYVVPGQAGGNSDNDLLTLVGDLLLLKQGDRLLTLPVNAEPGSAMKLLEPRARRISYGSHAGQVAASLGRDLVLLDPATGHLQLPPELARPEEAFWLAGRSSAEITADGIAVPQALRGDPVAVLCVRPRGTAGRRPS